MDEGEVIRLTIAHWMDQQVAENDRLAAAAAGQERVLEGTVAQVAYLARVSHFILARSVLSASHIVILEALALLPNNVGLREQGLVALQTLTKLDIDLNNAFTDTASPFDPSHWFGLIDQANRSWKQQLELLHKRALEP